MKKSYLWELAVGRLGRLGMSVEEVKGGFVVRKGDKAVRFTSLSDVLRMLDIVELFVGGEEQKSLDKEVENGYNNN